MANNTFKNKNYLIFGATGGIGSAVSRNLSKNGSKTILVGRDKDKLNTIAEELDSDTRLIENSDFSQIKKVFDSISENSVEIDGVVNCIGSLHLKPPQKTSEEEWHSVINTNMSSSFAILKYGLELLKENGAGAFVFISSAAALSGFSSHEAIAAAKAGIIGMVKSAASTYSRYNVRVNCVAPSLVKTPMTKHLTESEAIMKKTKNLHPLGRIGEPEDIASAVCWLLSNQQSWVTGQTISVDGGITAVKN